MPTFGETGSGTANSDNYGLISYLRASLPDKGTVKTISVYVVNACNVRVALYTNTTGGQGVGVPNTLIVESASVAHAGGGFQAIDIPDTVLEAGTYHFAVQVSAALKYIRYKAGTSEYHQQTYTYGAFPATASPGNYSASILSIYGFYSAILYQSVSEVLGMVDSVPTKASFKQSVSEVLGMVDSTPTKAAFKQAISEVLGMSDAVGTKAAFKQSVTEVLGMVDSAARVKGFAVTIAEILGLRDQIESRKHKTRIGDLPDHTITGGA